MGVDSFLSGGEGDDLRWRLGFERRRGRGLKRILGWLLQAHLLSGRGEGGERERERGEREEGCKNEGV